MVCVQLLMVLVIHSGCAQTVYSGVPSELANAGHYAHTNMCGGFRLSTSCHDISGNHSNKIRNST